MSPYLCRFLLVFVLTPLVLLGLFAWKKPRLTPLCLLICPVLDSICYWQELCYYESRPLMLLFLSLQLVMVAVLAVLIRATSGKRKTH